MQTNSSPKRKNLIYYIKILFSNLHRRKLKPKKYTETELTADGYTPAPTHLCKEYKKEKRK